MKHLEIPFRVGRRTLLGAATGSIVAVLALAPAASAKALHCGKMALAGSPVTALEITAKGVSCKAAESVIEDFASGKSGTGNTYKGWKARNRFIARSHRLKWTIKKGRKVITFEIKKTS